MNILFINGSPNTLYFLFQGATPRTMDVRSRRIYNETFCWTLWNGIWRNGNKWRWSIKTVQSIIWEKLRKGTSKDTVKTPKDFPLKYNYETGKNKKLRKRQASGVCLKQKLWESVQYVQEFIFAILVSSHF